MTGVNCSACVDLAAFTNLKRLVVSASSLPDYQGIPNVAGLEEIVLFNFSMPTDGADFLKSLSKVSSLKSLEFLGSHMHSRGNDFLRAVGTMMTNLTSFIVYNSALNCTIPQDLCNLKRLQTLRLTATRLWGELPQCLANLTSLRVLNIPGNYLSGDISRTPIASLFSLEDINISNNQFRIPLSFTPLFNHSHLVWFSGSTNSMIPEDNPVREQEVTQALLQELLFQLEFLDFSSRYDDFGGYVGPFPKFLYHQTNLEFVALSNTKMKGDFPLWLLTNNTNLKSLYVGNCSLSGHFQLSMQPHQRPHENLEVLDVSSNDLSPSLFPPNMFVLFPMLKSLDLHNNHFFGTMPDQMSNLLWLLDVSDNHLSGEIPKRIWNMPTLFLLDLSKNNFSGSLPPYFISSNIQEVYLSRNQLRGPLSTEGSYHDGIFRANSTNDYENYNLEVLDLSHNHFTGKIPRWVGEMPLLTYLLLNDNEFLGEVLTPFCLERLKLIVVSRNHLSGHLAFMSTSEGNACKKRMKDVSLFGSLEFITKTNVYTYNGRILTLMSGLDFSSNNFSGEIPSKISNLNQIKMLNLSHNKLTGKIPDTFSSMLQIESLDLSHNNLIGMIPPQLVELTSLESFSVAYNNFSGKCPKKIAQFGTFDESSYRGNPSLCCTYPIPLTKPIKPLTYKDEEDDGGNNFVDMESFYVSSGVSFVMALLIIASVLYINSYWRQVWFYCVTVTITSCYYFAVDHLPVPAKYRVWEPHV